MRDPKLTFLIRCAYGAVWLALIWLMVRYVLVWLLPFLIALALAALLEPAVVLCRRRLHLRRGFTATVLSLVVLGTVAAGLVLLAMVLLRQVCELSGRLPFAVNNGLDGPNHKLKRRKHQIPVERHANPHAGRRYDREQQLCADVDANKQLCVAPVPEAERQQQDSLY